jgi:hypothetical protein
VSQNLGHGFMAADEYKNMPILSTDSEGKSISKRVAHPSNSFSKSALRSPSRNLRLLALERELRSPSLVSRAPETGSGFPAHGSSFPRLACSLCCSTLPPHRFLWARRSTHPTATAEPQGAMAALCHRRCVFLNKDWSRHKLVLIGRQQNNKK